MESKLPHWDLSNVYSGLEAGDFEGDLGKLSSDLDALQGFFEEHGIDRLPEPPADAERIAKAIDPAIEKLNHLIILAGTLRGYVTSFVTTDSRNTVAAKRQSELDKLQVRLQKQAVRFQAWVGSLAPLMDRVCEEAPVAADHRKTLDDYADQSRYLMSTDLEDLASELQMTGGGIMSKLQGTVTSQLKMPITRDGKTGSLPMTMIRNLAGDPDEGVRKQAYEAELKGWEQIREPVAFALNSVKGSAITLSKRRGRDDVLHGALDRNKIDRATLDALWAAVKDSFPTFRRYLKSKAKKLGKEKLPWWDLLAPVASSNPKYTWEECADFVVEQFGKFTPELADYARHAFDKKWIDAEPRDGKRGGAFCMRVPGVEESRILTNFDGSFGQLTTVAHELGHGFHNHCQKGLPALRRGAPMCLAETASIFCETLVFNAAIKSVPEEQQLAILENRLKSATQVTVDIYSRFLFESEVVRRREKAELSAAEMCEIMLDAQKQSYGDGLDHDHLHPYMWLLKPHYYSEAHFYNYPYAFGMLFGLGVYARYQQEGESFIPKYKELLRSTGAGKAADLAARFGIDIRDKAFWAESLSVLAKQVDEYASL